jgi:hypothetical protein
VVKNKNWRLKMTTKNPEKNLDTSKVVAGNPSKTPETPKEKSNPKQSQATPKETILTVSELAKKLGILPKRLRSFLRAEYPRDNKGKKWELTTSLAGKIEKDYKAKIKAKDEAKKEESKKVGDTLLEKEKVE